MKPVLQFRFRNYSDITCGFLITLSVFILAVPQTSLAGPTSATYELKDYGFGSGGSENSTSTNYNLFGISGETSGDKASSASYSAVQGLVGTIQADVPPAPTFTNPDSYYNKLKLVINTGGNPANATYAIAISTDNFLSDTKYVQSDNTVGATLGSEDWQTYTVWGGASGIYVIGLTPGTTYTVKVEAQRGNFTQTGFGPTAQATTSNPTLTFDIDVSSTDSETASPYNVSVGSLTAGSVTTASDKVWIDLETNGTAGSTIYVQGTNNGLLSSNTGYTISSVSGDLTSTSEGYGAQGSTVAESSGGPLSITSPYNGTSDVVGPLDATNRIIFDTSGNAITSGRASFTIKAKASAVTKAGGDYSDTLTLVASAGF